MAGGSRTTNTMAEGLRVLLADIADMKLAPDADLPFLINIETNVLGYLKSKADAALQPPGGGGMPGGPSPMGQVLGGGGGPSLPGQGTPQQVPGVMQGPGTPNPDELRRVLSQ